MSPSERIIVATGADENYAMPLAMTLFSAARTLGKDQTLEVQIIDGGMSRSSIERIERTVAATGSDVRLVFLKGDVARLEALGLPISHVGVMAYLRLLLPELLPPHLEHVLYLDSDLLICDCLSGLWAFRSEHAIAGVPDYASIHVSSPQALPNWRDLGLPERTPYFNSGVLLMNLPRWRDGRLSQRVLEYTLRHKDINRFADQDGINAILGPVGLCLPWRWNVPVYLDFPGHHHRVEAPLASEPGFAGFSQWLRQAGIIHFVSSRKPWRRGLASGYAQSAWLKNCRQSGWFSRSEYWRFAGPIELDRAFRKILRRVRGH